MRVKLAGVATPGTVAVAENVPVLPFAMMTVEVAKPEGLVVTVSVLAPPAKVPPAPVAGSAKVTLAPDTHHWPRP